MNYKIPKDLGNIHIKLKLNVRYDIPNNKIHVVNNKYTSEHEYVEFTINRNNGKIFKDCNIYKKIKLLYYYCDKFGIKNELINTIEKLLISGEAWSYRMVEIWESTDNPTTERLRPMKNVYAAFYPYMIDVHDGGSDKYVNFVIYFHERLRVSGTMELSSLISNSQEYKDAFEKIDIEKYLNFINEFRISITDEFNIEKFKILHLLVNPFNIEEYKNINEVYKSRKNGLLDNKQLLDALKLVSPYIQIEKTARLLHYYYLK